MSELEPKIKYDYDYFTGHRCIDAYKIPDDINDWDECPNCNRKPKVWCFNNGRSTACRCGKDIYDHHSIKSESIMSHLKRFNGNTTAYDCHELKTNWNHWCRTGEILFRKDYSKDGMW